jgi:hypothetical protein
MRTRTLLTTPPGEEPAHEDAVRHADPERYSPALTIPGEPPVPGRRRRLWIALAVLVVVGLAGVVLFRVLTAGQFQDPALTEDPAVEEASRSAGP